MRREGEEEAVDEEMMTKLLDLRSFLETRVQELENEAVRSRLLFKIVDQYIIDKSFRRAEVIAVPSVEDMVPVETSEKVPLKTPYGVLLATMYVTEDTVRIVPSEGLTFNVDTPPFKSFLINRVLDSMQSSDREASRKDEMPPEVVLTYEVITEGSTIKEIRVKNYGSPKRLREINSTSRWTLEKMYEKTRSPS